MKKIFLTLLALLAMSPLFASNDNTEFTAFADKPTPSHLEFRYYGFYGAVDFTFMTNLNKQHDIYTDNYNLMGMTAVAGFQWRKESAVGLGISYLSDPVGSFSQIPIFMELRSYYTRQRLAPYSAIQFGYSIPLGTVNSGINYVKLVEGGITAGVEVGARVAISRHFGLNLGVGYQMIQSRIVERGIQGEISTQLPELYHNLKVNVGFNF